MRRKNTIILVIVVLMLALWPPQVSRINASVLAGVSPLAVPVRNLWGAPKGEAVDVTFYRSGSTLGWSWSREYPAQLPGEKCIQPIYPNARIALKSPVIISDIQSFNLFAGFGYSVKPNGSYNLAFDIFLREPSIKAPKAEIMVWLDGTQKQPSRYLRGKCSDGNNTYVKYWWTKADGLAYHSYLLELPLGMTPGPIDLKTLIDDILPDKNLYISEVELGTEVWNGSGAVQINTYYIELNGERL